MPRSILVIDDDPGVLSVLTRFFQRKGWEVHQAGSGEDGLRRWEATRPDAVLLDLDLPGMSGRQVLDVLVGLRPGRPTVRLEAEQCGDSLVVHNYGHGGGGFTLSWGCAEEVLALIQGQA